MFIKRLSALIVLCSFLSTTALADYTIKQRTTIDGNGMESSILVKGVRTRTLTKILIADIPEAQRAMMESMMPPLTSLSQCDLKQEVVINEKEKAYFVEYLDWSAVPPEKLARRPKLKVSVKGTVTMSSVVTDSGKRQKMFGLNARWLKYVMEIETSADSCDGAKKARFESEGWFVDLNLRRETCPVPPPPPANDSGCRPRPIYKGMQDPGFFLEGTRTGYENGIKGPVEKLETLELTTATLEQSLFEVPTLFTEVNSVSELMKKQGVFDASALTRMSGSDSPTGRTTVVKTVAIDFFSGSSSKVDQNQLRNYVSSKLSASGMSGYLVSSQAEIQSGNFVNTIGVEIKKLKESGGAKVGGLFGKITGNSDAAKLGETEAEIVITVLGQDRKTIVATVSASGKVKGGSNEAIQAAIDQAMPQVIAKLK